MDLSAYLKNRKQQVDRALKAYLPGASPDYLKLAAAIKYSLLSGGKRIRPILCIATAEACGASSKAVMQIACALECIHVFTLIHDDLPSIDNSDFRRGKNSCHKAFGDAAAILAGDSLALMGFEIILKSSPAGGADAKRYLSVLKELSHASGFFGVIGGEAMDIAFEKTEANLASLKKMYAQKTGALITASVRCGAIMAGADEKKLSSLTSFAGHLGLAFQITDDLLDLESSSKKTGKPVGQDKAMGKATILGSVGLDKAMLMAEEEIEAAIGALNGFGKAAEPLREIARFVLTRRM